MRMKWICGILCLLLVCVTASAQTVTGTLSGHVTDKTGAVIPGVKVTAVNATTGAVREATTNAEGFFQFNFVPIGTYDVTSAHDGFRVVKKTGVAVELNNNTVSDFSLD